MAHEGRKFISPMHRLPLPPKKYSWYSFLLDPRAIVWPDSLFQWKIPKTPTGIKPMTFWPVAQCLTNCTPLCPIVFSGWLEKWSLLRYDAVFYVNGSQHFERVCACKTSGANYLTLQHIPEDLNSQQMCCESHKSHNKKSIAGTGRLSDNEISNLKNYYDIGIRRKERKTARVSKWKER